MVDRPTGGGHRHRDEFGLYGCHSVAGNMSDKWWVKTLLDRGWETRGEDSSLTGLLYAQVGGDHEPPQRRLAVVNRHGCRGVSGAFFAFFKEGLWR